MKSEQPEPREGIVTVHHWDGRYLGCMGIVRWEQLLAEDAADERCDGCGVSVGGAGGEPHFSWCDEDDERVYTFFHPDGPIRLTETELVNDYMRLREAASDG